MARHGGEDELVNNVSISEVQSHFAIYRLLLTPSYCFLAMFVAHSILVLTM